MQMTCVNVCMKYVKKVQSDLLNEPVTGHRAKGEALDGLAVKFES